MAEFDRVMGIPCIEHGLDRRQVGLMITGCVNGKSIFAVNAAMNLAVAGKKVKFVSSVPLPVITARLQSCAESRFAVSAMMENITLVHSGVCDSTIEDVAKMIGCDRTDAVIIDEIDWVLKRCPNHRFSFLENMRWMAGNFNDMVRRLDAVGYFSISYAGFTCMSAKVLSQKAIRDLSSCEVEADAVWVMTSSDKQSHHHLKTITLVPVNGSGDSKHAHVEISHKTWSFAEVPEAEHDAIIDQPSEAVTQ